MQLRTANAALVKRGIMVAINQEGPVFAIDIIAHREGWNASLRQGPARDLKPELADGVRLEHALAGAAAFLGQFSEAGAKLKDVVDCVEHAIQREGTVEPADTRDEQIAKLTGQVAVLEAELAVAKEKLAGLPFTSGDVGGAALPAATTGEMDSPAVAVDEVQF